MTRAEIAKQKFNNGYNCAQAVAIAFSDLIGLTEPQAAKMVSGFGGGLGRQREVCGSVLGMSFVISCLYGYDNPKAFDSKKQLYSEIQQCSNEFKKQNGSIICRELLGIEQKLSITPTPEKRTQEYYQKRPCAELVECSAAILENFINSKE